MVSVSSSLIGCPIISALCQIEAKSFINYIKILDITGTDGESDFESHWVPYSFGFVPNRSKELCKLHEDL